MQRCGGIPLYWHTIGCCMPNSTTRSYDELFFKMAPLGALDGSFVYGC